MKILVCAYTGLGNLVLKTPFLKAIKVLYPTCKLSLFIGDLQYLADLFEGNNLVDEFITFDENHTEIEKKDIIKAQKHDLLFLPFDALVPIFVKNYTSKNYKKIYRHFHQSKSFLQHAKRVYTANTKWIEVRKGVHEIELNIDLLKPLLENTKPDLETFISIEEDKSILDKFEINEPYIVVQAEAANGTDPTKCWHKDNFVLLLKELVDKYRHDIVLVGDKKDYLATIKYIEKEFIKEDKIIVTAGGTDLKELKNLLYYSNLIICHDSGIMHLADALNKRLIAFFGPSDFARVRPTKKNSNVLFSHTEYFNIKEDFKKFTVKNLKKNQPLNYPMSAIKLKDVLLKVDELISLD